MTRFYDIIDCILLIVLCVSGLTSFIRLITLGDIALGICGIVSFILFALVIYRRDREED